MLTPAYGAVFAHPFAHINVDECGAPEFYTGGGKLISVVGEHGKIDVAAIRLTGELKAGDTIHIKGHTSDFTTTVDSMQIEHESVTEAGPGAAIGVKVPEKAHEHDRVFKVCE